MKTCRITAETNGWIASQDIRFNGKTRVTLGSYDSIEEAREAMLRMFNEEYDMGFKSWGLAVAWSNRKADCAGTDAEGMRYYREDGRSYRMEPMMKAEDVKDIDSLVDLINEQTEERGLFDMADLDAEIISLMQGLGLKTRKELADSSEEAEETINDIEYENDIEILCVGSAGETLYIDSSHNAARSAYFKELEAL